MEAIDRHILRGMAWEGAKGELNAMLHAFVGERKEFEALDKVVNTFIKNVEDESLY